MKTQKGWAIVGPFGLYVGWSLGRSDAIRDHVADKCGVGPRFGPLTASQKEAWRLCRKEGDRAVKVTIAYQ